MFYEEKKNIHSNLPNGASSGHWQTISTQTCSSLQVMLPQSGLTCAGHGEFTSKDPPSQIHRYTVSRATWQVPGPQSTPSQAANKKNKDLLLLKPSSEGCGKVMFLQMSVCPREGGVSPVQVLSGQVLFRSCLGWGHHLILSPPPHTR